MVAVEAVKVIEAILAQKLTNAPSVKKAIEEALLNGVDASIQNELIEISKLTNAKTMKSRLAKLSESLKSNSNEIEMSSNEESNYVPSDIEELDSSSDNDDEPMSLRQYATEENTIKCYNYVNNDKFAKCPDAKQTGLALLMNNVRKLAIVDFDIHKDITDLKQRTNIQSKIYNKLHNFLDDGEVFVYTKSDGVHIWCLYDGVKNPLGFDSNQNVAVIKTDEFDIDILVGVFADKRQLATLPETQGYNKITNELSSYNFQSGSWDKAITLKLETVLKRLDSEFGVRLGDEPGELAKKAKQLKESDAESTLFSMNDSDWDIEIQKALVDGLRKPIVVHGATHKGKGLDKEVSLMPLFKTLNSLHESLREQAYNKAFKLTTDSAETMFDSQKLKLEDEKEPLSSLAFIIKTHNPNYYKEKVLPLMKVKFLFELKKFDLRDPFKLKDFMNNAAQHKYRSLDEAATDLSRLYRYNASGKPYFLEKAYNSTAKMNYFKAPFMSDVKAKLKDIELFKVTKDGKTTAYSAWDAFNKYKAEFVIEGTTFSRILDDCLTIWNGWKYEAAQTFNPDDENTKNYFKLVDEVICGNAPEGTNAFIHKWVAAILQKPGYMNRVAIVLQGIHRAGKGTFVDILCELTAGHSQPNINKIDEIVGSYNKCIENCVIIVCNELQTKDGKPTKVVGALKSYITDSTLRVGDTFEPVRTVENVGNYIFITNSARAIGIEATDPRYLVLEVDGRHRMSEFLRSLHHLPKEFYENLMAYYMSLDISDFEAEVEKPTTGAELDLKFSSLSYAEKFIREHYKHFSDKDRAFTEKTLKANFECSNLKDKMQFSTFVVDIRAKCQRDIDGARMKVVKRKGKTERVYLLKDEYLDAYKPDEDVEQESSEE